MEQDQFSKNQIIIQENFGIKELTENKVSESDLLRKRYALPMHEIYQFSVDFRNFDVTFNSKDRICYPPDICKLSTRLKFSQLTMDAQAKKLNLLRKNFTIPEDMELKNELIVQFDLNPNLLNLIVQGSSDIESNEYLDYISTLCRTLVDLTKKRNKVKSSEESPLEIKFNINLSYLATYMKMRQEEGSDSIFSIGESQKTEIEKQSAFKSILQQNLLMHAKLTSMLAKATMNIHGKDPKVMAREGKFKIRIPLLLENLNLREVIFPIDDDGNIDVMYGSGIWNEMILNAICSF